MHSVSYFIYQWQKILYRFRVIYVHHNSHGRTSSFCVNALNYFLVAVIFFSESFCRTNDARTPCDALSVPRNHVKYQDICWKFSSLQLQRLPFFSLLFRTLVAFFHVFSLHSRYLVGWDTAAVTKSLRRSNSYKKNWKTLFKVSLDRRKSVCPTRVRIWKQKRAIINDWSLIFISANNNSRRFIFVLLNEKKVW